MSVEVQFQIIISLAMVGFLMGIIFDFYHILIKFCKIKSWLQVILDFFLWIIITCLTAAGLIKINWGEVRIYVFLAIGLGLLIYYLYFSYLIKKIMFWIINKILIFIRLLIRIYVKIARHVLRPLFRAVSRLFGFICSPFCKLFLGLKLKFKRKMKPLCSLLNKIFNKFNRQGRIF